MVAIEQRMKELETKVEELKQQNDLVQKTLTQILESVNILDDRLVSDMYRVTTQIQQLRQNN